MEMSCFIYSLLWVLFLVQNGVYRINCKNINKKDVSQTEVTKDAIDTEDVWLGDQSVSIIILM